MRKGIGVLFHWCLTPQQLSQMSGSSDKPQDLVTRKLHAVTFQWVLLAVKEGPRPFKKGGGEGGGQHGRVRAASILTFLCTLQHSPLLR